MWFWCIVHVHQGACGSVWLKSCCMHYSTSDLTPNLPTNETWGACVVIHLWLMNLVHNHVLSVKVSHLSDECIVLLATKPGCIRNLPKRLHHKGSVCSVFAKLSKGGATERESRGQLLPIRKYLLPRLVSYSGSLQLYCKSWATHRLHSMTKVSQLASWLECEP